MALWALARLWGRCSSIADPILAHLFTVVKTLRLCNIYTKLRVCTPLGRAILFQADQLKPPAHPNLDHVLIGVITEEQLMLSPYLSPGHSSF